MDENKIIRKHKWTKAILNTLANTPDKYNFHIVNLAKSYRDRGDLFPRSDAQYELFEGKYELSTIQLSLEINKKDYGRLRKEFKDRAKYLMFREQAWISYIDLDDEYYFNTSVILNRKSELFEYADINLIDIGGISYYVEFKFALSESAKTLFQNITTRDYLNEYVILNTFNPLNWGKAHLKHETSRGICLSEITNRINILCTEAKKEFSEVIYLMLNNEIDKSLIKSCLNASLDEDYSYFVYDGCSTIDRDTNIAYWYNRQSNAPQQKPKYYSENEHIVSGDFMPENEFDFMWIRKKTKLSEDDYLGNIDTFPFNTAYCVISDYLISMSLTSKAQCAMGSLESYNQLRFNQLKKRHKTISSASMILDKTHGQLNSLLSHLTHGSWNRRSAYFDQLLSNTESYVKAMEMVISNNNTKAAFLSDAISIESSKTQSRFSWVVLFFTAVQIIFGYLQLSVEKIEAISNIFKL
ncbi:MAG: hypothetical protein COB27_009725 [Moritella sp.]|uniref:hypothetical protein n=1 Tax=Moritella sp. TaxID=78556 RepID=UPI00216D16ED|nr:hypothetical protein [Moritella sp.]MBL1417142.1 hypothetical protein [Moritella sp.]